MKEREKEIIRQIPAPLLLWYRANKRKLPWRDDPTPYHIWLSEIMLQQTRVEAVKEYYTRFITALPTIEDLANCKEEELLKLWEGLGYYSRVRNLQRTAKTLVLEFNGELPSDITLLKKLSGIGEYTAGAIASIAFGKRTSAVDGNVLRVITRLTENPTPISDTAYKKELQETLDSVYPHEGKDCADFTQSLFELGALVCKPQTPDCGNCPLKGICQSYQKGTQKKYPVIPKKKEKRIEQVFVFLLQTPNGFAIRRREQGVLKGMNEFPSKVVFDETPKSVLNEWGVYEFTELKRKNYVHIFTHIRWNITCFWVYTDEVPFDTYSLDEIKESISIPTAFRQCMELINEKV